MITTFCSPCQAYNALYEGKKVEYRFDAWAPDYWCELVKENTTGLYLSSNVKFRYHTPTPAVPPFVRGDVTLNAIIDTYRVALTERAKRLKAFEFAYDQVLSSHELQCELRGKTEGYNESLLRQVSELGGTIAELRAKLEVYDHNFRHFKAPQDPKIAGAYHDGSDGVRRALEPAQNASTGPRFALPNGFGTVGVVLQ